MQVVCLDLEGVLVPEIWINFAERTGIDALRATTRDIPDYDVLMRQRLDILDQHGLKLPDIQDVIASMGPMDGAKDFVDELRAKYQLIILSDTFVEFAKPLMAQLGWPTLFCHHLDVAENGRIDNYVLRMPDHKRHAVRALHDLKFKVCAAGDSYNDIGMLEEADQGTFFRAPENVLDDYPQYPLLQEYSELMARFDDFGKA